MELLRNWGLPLRGSRTGKSQLPWPGGLCMKRQRRWPLHNQNNVTVIGKVKQASPISQPPSRKGPSEQLY